jgi:hypothetical protein
MLGLPLLSGTGQRRGSNGTESTTSGTVGTPCTSARSRRATSAGKSLLAWLSVLGFAPTPANPPTVATPALTNFPEIASPASANSSATNTPSKGSVRRNVAGVANMNVLLRFIRAITAAYSSRPQTGAPSGAATVVGAPMTAGRRKVYNLSVEGAQEYFANGVLVHNCRYAAMSRPYTAPLPPSADDPEPDRYARRWRPARSRGGSAMAA